MTAQFISNKEYHEHPAISSSAVKAASRSLAHWKGAERKESTHFDLGTGFHDMVLEGGLNTVKGPENRRGQAWKILHASTTQAGKTLLTQGDYETCQKMSESCLTNPRVRSIVRHPDAVIEGSYFATCPETGLQLKCRPDAYLREKQVCLDLKSTQNAEPSSRGFEKSIFGFGYHLQAAHYTYVLRLNDLPVTHFAFAAVEKTSPYAQCLHVLSAGIMEFAHKKLMNVLTRMAEGIAKDEYPTDWPELHMVHLPEYLTMEEDE